jgi:hypothetical protein
MRPLALHVSALNDEEYDVYTTCFNDLVDDDHVEKRDEDYYERTVVGVREARAWLRGRYADLPTGDVDAVRYIGFVLLKNTKRYT